MENLMSIGVLLLLLWFLGRQEEPQTEELVTERIESPKKQSVVAMSKFMEIQKGIIRGYKKIENGVVSVYKAIENGVVSVYKSIEDKFVETFLLSGSNLESKLVSNNLKIGDNKNE